MSFTIQFDGNGDPFLFNEGDMGRYETVVTPYRNAATGDSILQRLMVHGTGKFTGGKMANGAPTVQRTHPEILPEDIPAGVPWPTTLGPDPR